MCAIRIDGKQQAAAFCEALIPKIQRLQAAGIQPGLRVVLVGEDPASMLYVRNKKKKAFSLGIDGQVLHMPGSATQEEVIAQIQAYNLDERVHSILVQMPLPLHIDAHAVIGSIAPHKDADGFHIHNMGALFSGKPAIVPCTPLGIIALIKSTGRPIAGAHAVVVGRSMIVGKPVSILLQQENATVTMCHSQTRDLGALTRQADILVCAIGQPEWIRGNMIKPGAVVIDVGMNRREDGARCGDVAFEEASKVAGFITPVPGGVGPMTIAMLMGNTVNAAMRAAAL